MTERCPCGHTQKEHLILRRPEGGWVCLPCLLAMRNRKGPREGL